MGAKTGHAQVQSIEGETSELGRQLALAIVSAGLEKKALQTEVIDVRGKIDYADYVVVMSGRSERQVSSIAKEIQRRVRTELGQRCVGIEGLPRGEWVLMDFSDVIVHVFHEDTRGYYDLESLWIDAARIAPVEMETVC
ncbi:MAG: ribosome silencing factor [Myxococcota bacterium]